MNFFQFKLPSPFADRIIVFSVEELEVGSLSHDVPELNGDVLVPLDEEQDEYSRLHPYPCDFCSRRFSKQATLTVSVEMNCFPDTYSLRGEDELTNQRETQSCLHQQFGFQVHMLTHQQRLHCCNMCDATFRRKLELVEHMKIHSFPPTETEENEDLGNFCFVDDRKPSKIKKKKKKNPIL